MSTAPPRRLDALIAALRVLPGVGARSAQRMAYHLLQRDRAGAQALARAIDEALGGLRHCDRCNAFSDTSLCPLCGSDARDPSRLCVVETAADQAMLEQARVFDGLYYVLMGRISPLDGIGPRELQLDRLVSRARDGLVREVILATNFNAEGDATAHVVSELLAGVPVAITRLSRGLPLGAELEHTDAGTLAQALAERRSF